MWTGGRVLAVVCAWVVALAVVPGAAGAAEGGSPYPSEYQPGGRDYKYTSEQADVPRLQASTHQLHGVKGASVDKAWDRTRGRDDVLIAVLDSGIKWRDAGAMADLRHKAHLNTAELPLPAGAAAYDADGNGRVDVDDWAADTRVGDRNANGLLDPEDLILAFSDASDDDGNGYVDDISGWDFAYGDNDPLDEVDYGHGTGEAKDSTAEADNGGNVGTCPRCRFVPVRVGDSFITDGGRFAAGVLFALDAGADLVQEALGAVSNPPQAQQVIDAAVRRGVPIVASMADEASKHPNLPAVLEHTMAVNSVTRGVEVIQPEEYLALNGCTNYGGHTFVSMESDGCSSEATGLTAGIVGLALSAQRDATEVGVLTRHPDLPPGSRNVLSPNEVYQLVRASADDVDMSTPNDAEGPNDFYVESILNGIRRSSRYPTTAGWDEVTGYGRVNAGRLVQMVADGDVPPEAEITSPAWFAPLPGRGAIPVSGRVAAVRERAYSWRLEFAAGSTPPLWPDTDTWHTVAEGAETAPRSGVLGTLSLDAVAAALPGGGAGVALDAQGLPDPERFSVRLRLSVESESGRRGEHQKQVFVQRDRGVVRGTPRRLPGGGGASSPAFADLDGDGAAELLLGTDDGRTHAYSAGMHGELPGWPKVAPVVPWWPAWSATAHADGIEPVRAQSGVGAPVVADLDADGVTEVAVTDIAGDLVVWEPDGTVRPGFPVHQNPAFSTQEARDERNRMKPGFFAMPSAADLDGDGLLELVASGLDRHVYAWHDDGTPVAGFPVLLVDPAAVGAVDPANHHVTFADERHTGNGGELTAVPAIGDLDGDGRPEIVVGAQESYEETANYFPPIGAGNSRVYAIWADGTAHPQAADAVPEHPSEQAYVPGWPFRAAMVKNDVLPTIGEGVATQAAIGDVTGDGRNEVITSSVLGPVYVLDGRGRSIYGDVSGLAAPTGWIGGLLGPDRNSHDDPIYAGFSGAAIGDLDGDAVPEFAQPTAGLGKGADTLLPHLQSPADAQAMAWSGGGRGLWGLPRVTADLSFFVSPAIADVDGDGRNETVQGNGIYSVDAFAADGSVPEGWPKTTGGWVVGTPAFGDWDGDGKAEVAVVRRDGFLFVWRTEGPSCPVGGWPRFGHDGTNAGNATPSGPC